MKPIKKNRNIKIVKAKKEYKCDCCNKTIKVDERYLRMNINRKGIFHFCSLCKDEKDFINEKIEDPCLDYASYEDRELFDIAYDDQF